MRGCLRETRRLPRSLTGHSVAGDGASLPSPLLLKMLPLGSYMRLISTLLILGQWVLSRVKPRQAQEERVKVRRRAEWWCERKGGCCCGWRRLSWHVACVCLGFTFRMALDGCGDGAGRGEGGAVRRVSSAGSVVARAGGVAAATMVGQELSEVGKDVDKATDESRGVSVTTSDKGSAATGCCAGSDAAAGDDAVGDEGVVGCCAGNGAATGDGGAGRTAVSIGRGDGAHVDGVVMSSAGGSVAHACLGRHGSSLSCDLMTRG